MSEEESKRREKKHRRIIEAVKWLDDLDGVILVMDATEDPYTPGERDSHRKHGSTKTSASYSSE